MPTAFFNIRVSAGIFYFAAKNAYDAKFSLPFANFAFFAVKM